MIKKLKAIFDILKTLKFTNTISSIKPCDVLLFCHDVDRGVSLNDQAYSPLIDSMRDEFEKKGYKCISIAHPWSSITGKHGYGNPVNMNSFFLLAKIFEKIGFNLRLKLYDHILEKSCPKLIVTIGCNSELCRSARDLGVFHAELLHGIGYKPVPWGWDKEKEVNLPKCILSLDSISTKTFSELESKGIIIKEIPHPFLKRFQSNTIENIPNEWLPINTKSSYEKEILISLQWGYANEIDAEGIYKDILDNGLFYSEIEEVISKTTSTVYWRFRFHPVQYRQKNKYKKQFELIENLVRKYGNCEWEESTYMPLPSILMQCSGHITMSSMVSYEAAYVGVPTLALCPILRDGKIYDAMFNDLMQQDYLLKQPPQVNNILEWVNNVGKVKPMLKEINNKSDIVDWLFSQTKMI